MLTLDINQKDQKEIEKQVIINSYSTSSKKCIETVCKGTSDYLVDTDRGAIKSRLDSNVKRQKYSDIGKVIKRKFKGKVVKFGLKLKLNREQMRQTLYQNKK